MKVKVKLKAKGLNLEFLENGLNGLNPGNHESVIIESYQIEENVSMRFKLSFSR